MNQISQMHTTDNPVRGLQLCLLQLYKEATALGLPFVAHTIGIAAEAARDEARKWKPLEGSETR